MTEAPWYWTDADCDHWAVGLVACVGDNGRIHYARDLRAGDNLGLVTACNRHPKNLRLLDGPRIVECRICCAVARGPNRDRIDQRVVRPLISGASRMNFIVRERQRRLHD